MTSVETIAAYHVWLAFVVKTDRINTPFNFITFQSLVGMGLMSKERIPKLSEKRVDFRHTLALDTEVHFHEQNIAGMFRCRTKNIGLNGTYIPSKAMVINSDMDVELVFVANSHSTPRQYRLKAQVVRSSDSGAGLVFPKLDNDQQQEFRRFLFRAKVAARHRAN